MSTENLSAAKGTTLEIGSPAVAIAHLKNIESPNQTKETIEVTALDSDGNYREYIPGYRDGGEISVTGYFDFKDAGQKAVREAYDAEEAFDFVIRYPARIGAEWRFKGIVTGYRIVSEEGDAITIEITIKISGKPVLVASSGGLQVGGNGGGIDNQM